MREASIVDGRLAVKERLSEGALDAILCQAGYSPWTHRLDVMYQSEPHAWNRDGLVFSQCETDAGVRRNITEPDGWPVVGLRVYSAIRCVSVWGFVPDTVLVQTEEVGDGD